MVKSIKEKKIRTKTQANKKGKWTRRGFITAGLITGGALVVGVAVRPGHRGPKLAKHVASEGEKMLGTWVKISPDNTITAIIPHAEMGQGVLTALGQMLAEEMDADWDNVKMIEAPGIKDYANLVETREFVARDLKVPKILMDTVDGAFLKLSQAMNMQITGGSLSVRFTGAEGLQIAGAAAKELLLAAAAKEWSVDVKSLRTEQSYIMHDPSNRRAPYAAFASAASEQKPNLTPTLKPRSDYTIMGQSKPRIDIPAKTDGTAMFGMDIDVEGMKIATIKAAPVRGQKVKSMRVGAAKTMSGVVDILNMGDYVAVIADGYWQAKQALDAVEIEFETGIADQLNQAGLYDQYRQDIANGTKKIRAVGKIDAAMEAADQTVNIEYTVPFLAHATMEPMNATAWVRGDQCDIWTGTQNPLGTAGAAAKAVGLKTEQVTVHNQYLGGGFGRRATPDYSDQAAILSQKTGQPIKLIWSREEDMRQDQYRPACVAQMRAGLDAKGMPTAWESKFVHKLDPVNASAIPYDIGAQYMGYCDSPSHIRLGPWRSVDHTQHAFFTESFIDELAQKSGQDGYQFRRTLLKGKPRFLAVLDKAAKLSGFGKTMPTGMGQGISIHKSFDTIVAEVATVDMRDGTAKVTEVVCVADAGMAVSPDGFSAQMESGIIYGLTAALYGEISIENGAVQQSNFHDYQMIRMDNAPKIKVHILQSDAPLGGAGEPGTPPIAPAVTNAIFAATGKRIRNLPVMNTDFEAIG